jgi:hypothetical protein
MKINSSGVQFVPQPRSYTLIPSNPANSPNNSNEDSEDELLNIAGKSIFIMTRFTKSEPLTTMILLSSAFNILNNRASSSNSKC